MYRPGLFLLFPDHLFSLSPRQHRQLMNNFVHFMILALLLAEFPP